MNSMIQPITNPPQIEGYVRADTLLKTLFPNKKDRMSRRTLGTHMRNRTIPYVKLGRSVLFRVSEVVKALESRQTVKAIR